MTAPVEVPTARPPPPTLPHSSPHQWRRHRKRPQLRTKLKYFLSRNSCAFFTSSAPVVLGSLILSLLLLLATIDSALAASDADQPSNQQMSPSLEGFSDQTEDLMFEDSVDVATSHYLSDEDAESMATRVGTNGSSLASSSANDHILRPFSRREKRNQFQQNPRAANIRRQQRIPASNTASQDFSLPVVDLKRIPNDNFRHPSNHLSNPASFFKKRLPLMGNSLEEGFLLGRPNSGPPPSQLERRQDHHHFGVPNSNSARRASSSDVFRRRFGDESVNFNSNGDHVSADHHQLGSLRAFLEESDHNDQQDSHELNSLNDLDLDDLSPGLQQGQRLPKSGGHQHHNPNPHSHHRHPNHNHPNQPPNHFKHAHRKPIRSAKFGDQHHHHNSIVAPPTSSSSPGSATPSNGAPISQIMPLFFDKFLAEFGNAATAHLPPALSPEGFSLPPSPSPVAPTSSAADGGDLDAPRGPPASNLPGGLHLKPEIGPPLFSNDLVQPSPPSTESGGDSSGSSGGPWPKIFRFTDGRINLHDFEREKKRSRVKFSAKLQSMASKAAALYNIKRESFLILHGGTFSQ